MGPKYYFNYHQIGNANVYYSNPHYHNNKIYNNCKGLNKTTSLRLTKVNHSINKPHDLGLSKAKHSSSRSAPKSTKNDMDKSIKGHTKPHVSMKDKPENQSQLEITTPKNSGANMPCKRLFHETLLEKEEYEIDIVPTGTDLEVLLINSCRIDAIKV